MKKRKSLLIGLFSLVTLFLLSGCEAFDLDVFDPKGPQAREIMGLINWSLIWIGIIFVVVIAMFIYIVWKYRASRNHEDYDPEEKGNHKLEVIWTLIPFVICVVLLIPNSKVLYKLEDFPEEYKNQEPLTIHVTSADWKWIFSYPELGIETVNYMIMPVDTPVTLKLTSAGTMQSLWIPSLAGQEYTMVNMETELPIVADVVGEYWGKNTNFNGEGYQSMEFEVLVQTQEDFNKWVQEIKEKAPKLTEEEYAELLQPSVLGQTKSYSSTHLEFVNHADHSAPSTKYLNPEKYLHDYEYPGKIFDEKITSEDKHDSHEEHDSHEGHESHGGDHSGH